MIIPSFFRAVYHLKFAVILPIQRREPTGIVSIKKLKVKAESVKPPSCCEELLNIRKG